MDSLIHQELKALSDVDVIISDGYPRTMNQALTLDDFVEDEPIVFYLDLPEELLRERLYNRGRADDAKEIIDHRFAVYREETEALIRYYKKKDRLILIKEKSSKKVFKKIQSYLD